jgi:glycosyltransferase involved in cell wall biosynthesis
MKMIHPAQALHVANPLPPSSDLIHFVFVGRTFFGKGGYQLLKAYEIARQKKLPVRLSIVSSLTVDGFRDVFLTKAIQEETRRLLNTLPDINYYAKLSGNEITDLLKTAQVGILPSFSETYGYFLLEAMSCGCSVVRTNISPFDEIAPESCSYSLSLGFAEQQKEISRVELLDPSSFQRIHSTLTDSLIDVFEKICADPDLLLKKQHAAIQKIRSDHDPLDRAIELETLYKMIKIGQL